MNVKINAAPKYGCLERVFRTSVFQYAVYPFGWIEKILIYFFRCCSSCACCPGRIDPKRMENSIKIFEKMGARIQFVTPLDGRAKVHMMTIKASDLEKKIKEHGGTWKKMGKEFLIVPPNNVTDAWIDYQNNVLLNKTDWETGLRKIGGKTREVIVTCKNADLIDEKKPAKCFLHAHAPQDAFARQRRRAGFYLGMKQDLCFYDPRGVFKSKGTPSEKGYYFDAEAVLDAIKSDYKYSDIFLTGTCGGGPVLAHLKKKYHDQGINFIAEKSFVDLRKEMINTQFFLVRWIANWNLDALKSRDIDPQIGPREDYFSTEKKWESLKFSEKGKVIVVYATNDQTLTKGAEDRYVTLANKVNRHVYKIPFTYGSNGHNELCFKDISMHRSFIKKIIY